MLQEIINWMADLQVDEFFVDPMQPYNESYEQIARALEHRAEWPEINNIMSERPRYNAWKNNLNTRLIELWRKVQSRSPNTKAIACDHQSKLKLDMVTGEVMDWATYDSYED